MTRILITEGLVVASAAPGTDATDDLVVGDVLIEDGTIVRIAPSIQAEVDETIDAHGKVVIPGLVDTHRHVWQTVLRNSLPDGDLFAYVAQVLSLGRAFTPDDVYASNLLGAVGALDAGVTTLLDWSHISNTPDHSDAAIAALQASGIRSVYAHSTGLDPMSVWVGPESLVRHPEDIRRIVEKHHGSADSLLTRAEALLDLVDVHERRGDATALRTALRQAIELLNGQDPEDANAQLERLRARVRGRVVDGVGLRS